MINEWNYFKNIETGVIYKLNCIPQYENFHKEFKPTTKEDYDNYWLPRQGYID